MNTKLDDIFKSNNQGITIEQTSEDLCTDLEASMLLAKTSVPYSHRRIANNYVVLKNVCKFQIIQPRITEVERNLLRKYALSTLENTTITKANREILQLKDWAVSTDDNIRNDAVTLMDIRVKELKFILSDRYTQKSNEVLNGYKAIEAYLTNITKYYR